MENLILETRLGENFDRTSKRALLMAVANDRVVEFDFNGCKCIVCGNTNLEWLYRDYGNHWLMGWKEVGPDCVEEYSPELKAEIKIKEDEREAKNELQQQVYRRKEQDEKESFTTRVKGIAIELKDAGFWEIGKSKNTDSYGACVYEYAEGWAKLMQAEILKGKSVIECANETSHELGFLGITGFMYGVAVSILSQCWKYGEDLRKWHNKEYKHDGEGVVNPAILTISV